MKPKTRHFVIFSLLGRKIDYIRLERSKPMRAPNFMNESFRSVGTFAVQSGKTFGAEVTGVRTMSKVGLVRSIGADDVVDYTRVDFAETGQRYDVILDTGGASSLSHLRRYRTSVALSLPKGRP
jgi:hypothetical protein